MVVLFIVDAGSSVFMGSGENRSVMILVAEQPHSVDSGVIGPIVAGFVSSVFMGSVTSSSVPVSCVIGGCSLSQKRFQ